MMALNGQWILWVNWVLDVLRLFRLLDWLRVRLFLNLYLFDQWDNRNMILPISFKQHSFFNWISVGLFTAVIIWVILNFRQVFVAQTLGLVRVLLRRFRNWIIGKILLFCEFFESHLFPKHFDLALLFLLCGLRRDLLFRKWLFDRSGKNVLSISEVTGLTWLMGLFLWMDNLWFWCRFWCNLGFWTKINWRNLRSVLIAIITVACHGLRLGCLSL